MDEGLEIQGHGGTYKSHQKPRYSGSDSIIPQGFELVRDHRNDQSVDELISENPCFYRVSFKYKRTPGQRKVPNITTVQRFSIRLQENVYNK